MTNLELLQQQQIASNCYSSCLHLPTITKYYTQHAQGNTSIEHVSIGYIPAEQDIKLVIAQRKDWCSSKAKKVPQVFPFAFTQLHSSTDPSQEIQPVLYSVQQGWLYLTCIIFGLPVYRLTSGVNHFYIGRYIHRSISSWVFLSFPVCVLLHSWHDLDMYYLAPRTTCQQSECKPQQSSFTHSQHSLPLHHQAKLAGTHLLSLAGQALYTYKEISIISSVYCKLIGQNRLSTHMYTCTEVLQSYKLGKTKNPTITDTIRLTI